MTMIYCWLIMYQCTALFRMSHNACRVIIIIPLHVPGSVNGDILKQPKYRWSKSLYKRTSIVFSSLAVALVTKNICIS